MKSLSKYGGRTVLIYLLTMSLVAGCTLLQQRRRIPECKELFEQVENGWYRDSTTGLYRLNAKAMKDDRFGNFQDDECLLGLVPSAIEKLFGSPDTLYQGRMEYYMSEPCLGKKGSNENGCHCMSCHFDGEGGLKRILFTTVSEDIDYVDTVSILKRKQ
jgi:hypothetical protein